MIECDLADNYGSAVVNDGDIHVILTTPGTILAATLSGEGAGRLY